MSAGWIAAAVVSAVAHVSFAAWVENAEPKKKPRPPIELQLAKIAKQPEPPKPVPPPPPPPPEPVKPKLVKHVAKTPPPPPPPPETQKVGISEDATATESDVALPSGVTTNGEMGDGTSMNKDLPPPPPETPPAPPPAPRTKVFPSYEVTQLPKIKKPVSPEIPDAFRDAQREALVVVEVVIDTRGKVTDARVLRHADYGLDEAALAAAKATEFEPALMGTQPVPVRYQLPYRFKVRG